MIDIKGYYERTVNKLRGRMCASSRSRCRILKYDDLVHASIGICTEAGELIGADGDKVNTMEELGDALWYATLGIYACTDEPSDVEGHAASFAFSFFKRRGGTYKSLHENPRILRELYMSTASELLDIVKKFLWYEKKPDFEVAKCLFIDIYAIVGMFCAIYDFDIYKIISKNEEKLHARYKGHKFSKDEAKNRDLDNERRILEDGHS